MNALGSRLLTDYARAHTTTGNRRCHMIGIPLIVFSIVLALLQVPLTHVWTLAEPVILAVAVVQFSFDPPDTCVFVCTEIAFDLIGRALTFGLGQDGTLLLAAILFLAGWIFQFVGHSRFEKNRPAFFRNLVHLLVGPLWICRKLFI